MATQFSAEVYRTYTSKVAKLGTIMESPDGARYRFALNGAVALAAGRVVQSVVPTANHLNQAVAAATPAGNGTITVTLGATAVVADEYADGYVYINDAGADVTTEGYKYRIKSHPAANASASLVLTLYEDSPVKIALTTNSEYTLIRNPFRAVIIHPSPPTARVVGVAPCAVAANEYFWCQDRGPCAVLTEGTLLYGDQVVASLTVDGAVAPSAAAETDGPSLGQPLGINATGEESLIYLTIG